MSMTKFIPFFIALTYICSYSFASTPFEKGGKWGLLDEATGKTIVKPKYTSLTEQNGLYLGSVNQERKGVGLIPRYGIIDSNGKVIIPFYSDSISVLDDIIINHNSILKNINERQAIYFPYTFFYTLSGEKIGWIKGEVTHIFEGGYVVRDFKDKNHFDTFLYDKNLKIVGDTLKIIKIYPNYIETSNYNKRNKLEGMEWMNFKEILTLYDKKTFTPVIDGYSNLSLSENGEIMNFYKDGKKGFLHAISGEITYIEGSRCSTINGYNVYYDGNFENAKIGLIDGSTLPVHKVFKDKGEYVMLYTSENGEKRFCDISCDDVVDYPEVNLFTVKNDGKWGLYNTYKKEMLLPFVFPAPISKRKEGFVIVKNNTETGIYSEEGILRFNIKDYDVEISDSLIYIDKDWDPKGIYSLNKQEWLIPLNKYKSIKKAGCLFYCQSGESSFVIINESGKIVNTLNNISSINTGFYASFEDVVRFYGLKGKMGLINKDTGKVIADAVHEDDIAWGSGQGQNQRFAISHKTETGENVIIMTVSGRKVTSRFFNYGTPRGVIKQWGKKYLYQTF